MSAATAKYEKVFPDRYFKYRFTEPVYFNLGLIEEMENLPRQMKKIYDGIEFGRKVHNFTPRYTAINVGEVTDILNGEEPQMSLDIMLAPVEITAFDKTKTFISGGLFNPTETIIVSAAPKLTLSTSLSFLSMDLTSAVCICLFASVVSLLLTRKLWHAPVTKARNNFVQAMTRYLRVLWDIFSIFFFEPYPGQLEHISERFAFAFWVLGVTFIGFLMSCFLKSEFLNEKYFFIETIQDLQYMQRHANVQPLMIKDGLVYKFLTKIAMQDEDFHNWIKNNLNEDNFCQAIDLVLTDTYEEIMDGKKTLILGDQLLSYIFGLTLTQNTDMMNEWKTNFNGFYFSKSLKMDYIGIPVNISFLSNPLFRENYGKGMLVFFETSAFSYYDFYSKYAMDFVKWERPIKTASDLNIFAVSSVFYLTLCAQTICVAIFIVELILAKTCIIETLGGIVVSAFTSQSLN